MGLQHPARLQQQHRESYANIDQNQSDAIEEGTWSAEMKGRMERKQGRSYKQS